MLKVVSIFTGGGGLDLGLEAAGFDVVFSSDIDHHSCKSLEANKINSAKRGKPFLKNATILEKDIRELEVNEILSSISMEKGEVDLLAGGPPCQAFSIFGKRKGREDPRGKLLEEYKRILSGLAPKAFVFENVFGILTAEGGQVFEDLKKLLSQPGPSINYEISVHRLNAADFGVPQFRDRVFIIGSRVGGEVKSIPAKFGNPKEELSNLISWRTVKDGLRAMRSMGASGWNNHTGRNHSQRIIDRYAGMKYGQRDSKTRINKLDPKRPSYAIIVGSDAGGGKGHIHPYEPREVTPRESARMQTFPDWWWFSGTGRHPIRQVGNAVPSLLGFSVGEAIMEGVFNATSNTFWDAVVLLDQQHLFSAKERELYLIDSLHEQQTDHHLAR